MPTADTDDADLVDRIFAYLLQINPTLGSNPEMLGVMKAAVRHEFSGLSTYIRKPPRNSVVAAQVLSLFNGRNATEVARELRISRATVYRLLKQPGNSSTSNATS